MLAEPAASAATAHSSVRTLRIFPLPAAHAPATIAHTWVEDDGVTADAAGGERDRVVISCELACTPDRLTLTTRATFYGSGSIWRPAFGVVGVALPPSERRPIDIEQTCVDAKGDASEQLRFVLLL